MHFSRRDPRASCPPMVTSPVIAEEFSDDDDTNGASRKRWSRSGRRSSSSRRMSRIMSMALPSRIMARLFPDSSSTPSTPKKQQQQSQQTTSTAAQTPRIISEPILINSTNIAAPDPIPSPNAMRSFHQHHYSMSTSPGQRATSMYDTMPTKRTSVGTAGGPVIVNSSNFF